MDSSLQTAAWLGDFELFNKIRLRGGNIHANAAEVQGMTCMQAALHANNLPIVSILLDLGADPKHVRSTAGFSILQDAVRDGNEALVRKLLSAGAYIRPKRSRPSLLATWIESQGARCVDYPLHCRPFVKHVVSLDLFAMILKLEGPNPPGSPTPLFTAVSERCHEIVCLLLAAGADVNQLSKTWFSSHKPH